MGFNHELLGLEHSDRFLDRWEVLADLAGPREEPEEGRKPSESIAESTSNQDSACGVEDAAELVDTAGSIADVVEHVREPRNVTTVITERDVFSGTGHVCDRIGANLPSSNRKHASRWFDPDDTRPGEACEK